MQILLESQRRRRLSIEGLLSLALHGLAIGAVVLAYREKPGRQDLVEQFVVYLAPPDRPPGGRADTPHQEYVEETAGAAIEDPAPDAVQLGTGPLVDEEGADSAELAMEASVLQELLTGSVLTELEVDSTVRREPTSAAPNYPPELLQNRIEGSAFVMFVVDSTGLVDLASYRVVRATHPEFAVAVRDALPHMKFRPALLGGVPVRQLVEQSFAFAIRPQDSIPPPLFTPEYLP